MKKRVLVSILGILGISGCALDDAVELGFDCPPKMFAYDVDPMFQEPYLCMLDNADVSASGVPNCVPCDFKMHKLTDDELIRLARNNNGNYIYSNKNANEENIDRKYLSEETKDYVVHKYSDYKKYMQSLLDDNYQNEAKLYAISGFCTRTDLERYDECNQSCNADSCDEECQKVVSRASKCFVFKGYNSFFKNNICPAEYPICSFGKYDETGNNFYCRSNIGECTPETVDIDCEQRITHWSYGRCDSNICVVRECTEGFQAAKDGKSCLPDCKSGQHFDNDAQKCLDDDIDNCGGSGKKCSEIVSHWMNGACEEGVCKVSECSEGFQVAIDNKSCVSDCRSGQHFDNVVQKCVDDDGDNCGATSRKCSENVSHWINGACEEGVCKVSECSDGFQPAIDGKSCVSNCKSGEHFDNTAQKCVNDDVDNCGATDKKCSDIVSQWVNGNCDAGVCLVGECSDGFQPAIDGKSCVSNCKSGEHFDNTAQKCVNDDINNCGATDKKCSDIVSQWVNGDCELGVCRVSQCTTGFRPGYDKLTCVSDCTSDQHYDNTAQKCVDDDIHNCGSTGYKCSANITGWGNGSCTNHQCIVSECIGSYHVYNNTCEPDSASNCGNHDYTCSEHISNWASGKCTNHECKLGACSGDFHVNGNACEQDSLSHCGSHGYKCSDQVAGWNGGTCTNHLCKATSCKSGYHLYNDSCEADSDTHCGSHGNKCETGESCQNKTCKCPGGYMNSTYNNKTVRAACITTKDDFINFRNAINAGNVWPSDNTDKYYILTRNVALGTQSSWVGVGTSAKPFGGIFLGNDKTISGSLTCSADYCGVFGYIGAYPNSTVLTDLRSSANVSSNYKFVGGIVGSSNYAGLVNLTSSGAVSGDATVGGIAGYNAPGNITGCTSSGSVTAKEGGAGGIVGSTAGCTVSNCSSSGTITAPKGTAGGIAGQLSGATVSNCHTSGDVSANKSGYAGGIIGVVSSGGTIQNCYATGSISANGTSGGVAGQGSGLKVISSYHIGTVSAASYAGGLVGEMQSSSSIKQSGAFGYISGSTVGGIVGNIVKDATSVVINNSFAVVELNGGNMGGLIGYSNATSTSGSNIDCNWVGSIFNSSSPNKGAVSYGQKSFTQNGPVYVYKPTYSSASNKDYVASESSTFTLTNKTPMVGNTAMLSALSASCSGGSWKNKSCEVNNGLSGKDTYTLPMPGITPSNCK